MLKGVLLCFALDAGAQANLAAFKTVEGFRAAPTLLRVTSTSSVAPSLAPSGSIRGTVKDRSDALIPGAVVTLATDDPSATQSTAAGSDGAFAFMGVVPGTYRLSVEAPGFTAWTSAASVTSGESVALPEIALAMSSVSTAIQVSASSSDVAAAQLGLEEKQRVLGIFPNFYASYIPNADPLTAKRKFSLAWRFAVDPVAFATAGVVAGGEQSHNAYAGYGRGLPGYAKRFGATYADGFSSTFLGGAIFPAIFHQDPRYFVKGTGSVPARALYAIATAVICKGDNRRWQLNYSNMLGNVASASLSNLYYPSADRHGASLTVQNALITTGFGALGGLFQEFLLHRMTPHLPDYGSGTR